VIIAAALVALLQVTAARTGTPSPLTTIATTLGIGIEAGASNAVGAVRSGGRTALSLPALRAQNAALKSENLQLQRENARLHEALAASTSQLAIQPQLQSYAGAIEARVIGFPPEGGIQTVTIDKGTRSGVARDDGVLAGPGVIGRVIEASPFTSQVALLTDFTSTIPALVQRGRYWGIARGNADSVRLEYVSQDAQLRPGDKVVTAEARSFHSGALLGTIVKIERDSALYQTAIVKPAVDFSTLDRVVVLPR
jgi:rod shape-determining protein MreC